MRVVGSMNFAKYHDSNRSTCQIQGVSSWDEPRIFYAKYSKREKYQTKARKASGCIRAEGTVWKADQTRLVLRNCHAQFIRAAIFSLSRSVRHLWMNQKVGVKSFLHIEHSNMHTPFPQLRFTWTNQGRIGTCRSKKPKALLEGGVHGRILDWREANLTST